MNSIIKAAFFIVVLLTLCAFTDYQYEGTSVVRTVTGDITADNIGIALPHEHIMINYGPAMDDPDLAKQELLLFGDKIINDTELNSYSTRTVVELTSRGLRDEIKGSSILSPEAYPGLLQGIAEGTGINIIMGSSYYRGFYARLAGVGDKTQAQIEAEIIDDIEIGAYGTSIKSGIIGEVGIATDFSDETNIETINELKVVKASCSAQLKTGAAINFHFPAPFPPIYSSTFNAKYQFNLKAYEKVFAIITETGVDPHRVVFSHFKSQKYNSDAAYSAMLDNAYATMKFYAQQGIRIEFDLFGTSGPESGTFINRLIADGYINNILISQDNYIPSNLTANGGTGYAYILNTLDSQTNCLTPQHMKQIMVDNTQNILPIKPYKDTDNDLWPDHVDNCPSTANPNQLDADQDGMGDCCDPTPGCGGSGNPACDTNCGSTTTSILTTTTSSARTTSSSSTTSSSTSTTTSILPTTSPSSITSSSTSTTTSILPTTSSSSTTSSSISTTTSILPTTTSSAPTTSSSSITSSSTSTTTRGKKNGHIK